jgi:hypothetical protein
MLYSYAVIMGMFLCWLALNITAVIIQTFRLLESFNYILALNYGLVGFAGILFLPAVIGATINAFTVLAISLLIKKRLVAGLFSASATFLIAWLALFPAAQRYNTIYMTGQLHYYAYPTWATVFEASILSLLAFFIAHATDINAWVM